MLLVFEFTHVRHTNFIEYKFYIALGEILIHLVHFYRATLC